jgi:WD40 repeat protein
MRVIRAVRNGKTHVLKIQERTWTEIASPSPIISSVFCPDDRAICAGCQDGSIRLIDSESGRLTATPLALNASVSAVAYSGDGRSLLVGTGDGALRIFDSRTWRPIGKPFSHPLPVTSIVVGREHHTFLTFSRKESSGTLRGLLMPHLEKPLTLEVTARLWEIPGVPVSGQGIRIWAETLTGMTITEDGSPRSLDHEGWIKRRMGNAV